MKNIFDNRRWFRVLEILPGLMVWVTLFFAVFWSFTAPLWMMYVIILFDIYWFFRVCYFVIFIVVSWRQFRIDRDIDWLKKVEVLPRFTEMYHLIFIPTYKEDMVILRSTFLSLAAAAYPMHKKCIVVLAGEERDRARFLSHAETLQQEFGSAFYKMLVTVHPQNVAGELPGKGSNIHYAGHCAHALIDQLGIPYENVIVSSFDVDTCANKEYFACLTYKYLTHPNPTRASYQPIALYNNNMWESSALVRVAAFGTTFWLLTELARPERLFTFSSHSMSFRALVDVGFWEKDIVTEDSRIFLQCVLRYNGDYHVVPIYVPVSMDTVMVNSYWRSLLNLYKQQRRWAWGVEHLPYLVRRFWGNKEFPWRKKLYYLFTVAEGMFTWATAPLLIFILGNLPILFAPASLRNSVFYQNTPNTLQTFMLLSMVGVFASALLSFALLPPMPASKKPHLWGVMLLQWALVPITFILFGAIPAIDAQTHLMFGRYLGFNVTEKRRT